MLKTFPRYVHGKTQAIIIFTGRQICWLVLTQQSNMCMMIHVWCQNGFSLPTFYSHR